MAPSMHAAATCHALHWLWSLEWPVVRGLEECAQECGRDPRCNFVFWQTEAHGAHPLGIHCAGYSACTDYAAAAKHRYHKTTGPGTTCVCASVRYSSMFSVSTVCVLRCVRAWWLIGLLCPFVVPIQPPLHVRAPLNS
jgi:hypothetical protein